MVNVCPTWFTGNMPSQTGHQRVHEVVTKLALSRTKALDSFTYLQRTVEVTMITMVIITWKLNQRLAKIRARPQNVGLRLLRSPTKRFLLNEGSPLLNGKFQWNQARRWKHRLPSSELWISYGSLITACNIVESDLFSYIVSWNSFKRPSWLL